MQGMVNQLWQERQQQRGYGGGYGQQPQTIDYSKYLQPQLISKRTNSRLKALLTRPQSGGLGEELG